MLSDYLKTLPQFMVPKQELTTFAGFMANVKQPTVKNYLIKRFIKKYHVNMQEALHENPEYYTTFNDFFIRQLKPSCRPTAQARVISPVDGCISEIGRIQQGQLLQAKGWTYSVQSLLASDTALASQFEQGLFATLYLSPKDYHRVHMPIAGTLKQATYVPGKLFSVQPTTARVIPSLFSRNERLVTLFDTDIGPMAMVLVGATIVGAIGTYWHGDIQRQSSVYELPSLALRDKKMHLLQQEEMGYFKLGSTVILLLTENCSLNWVETLQAQSSIRLGQALMV